MEQCKVAEGDRGCARWLREIQAVEQCKVAERDIGCGTTGTRRLRDIDILCSITGWTERGATIDGVVAYIEFI